jgi:hypothetical protein
LSSLVRGQGVKPVGASVKPNIDRIEVLVSEIDKLVEKAGGLGLKTVVYILNMAKLEAQILATEGYEKQ